MEGLVELLFASLVAAGVVVAAVEAAAKVLAPYQLEFGEGNVLASAIRVAQGETPYPPLAQPPHVFSQYGPLLYWILGPLVRWFGVGFAVPRLLTLIAFGSATALLVALLRRWTGSWRTGLLFGCLFVSLPEAGLWVALLRADALALAFSLAGVYAVSGNTRRWPVAALLFLAAILVKPTLVAAPAAVFLYLLLRRQTRDALGFGAVFAVGALLSFAALQWATGGAFAFHLFGSHAEPYTLRHYGLLAGLVMREQLIPTVMLAAFVAASVPAAAGRRPTLPLLYLGMALLGTLSAGIAGAASNHFLEWSAAVALGAGLAYHAAGQSPSPFARPLRSAALLAMVISALLFSSLLWLAQAATGGGPAATLASILPYQQRLFPVAELPQDCAALPRYLAALPGERMIAENTGAVLLAGKTLLLTDPFTYAQLVLAGKLSSAPIEDQVRRRQVQAIVLSQEAAGLRADGTDRWTPSLLTAVEQNYLVDRYFDCPHGNVVYLPRPAPQE